MKSLNDTLMTDFYELTMGQVYFDQGEKDTVSVFDVFFRENPFDGGYTISGGLDNIIDYIKNFKFDKEDIDYLRSTGNFSDEFLEYLSNLRFSGDIYCVPDGTVIFPSEPVITVKAPIIEAQLLETALLAYFNHGSLVTTKAKRITRSALGRPVMEFGARRARGSASAYEASKYSIVGGCVGTSNTKVSKELGVKPMGTMAHSLVTLFDDEREAFYKYALSNPDNCIFLVDTYDTLKSGIPNAIWVADNLLKPLGIEFKGIRIDSGDLVYLSKEARKMLDEAGYPNTKICLSNGLDEYSITSLIENGAVVDSMGVGDNISASKERLGGVYKLVSVGKDGVFVPRIKLSDDPKKTINPGFKRVFRFYDKKEGLALFDLITLGEEIDFCTDNYEVRELQEVIFKGGNLVYDMPSIDDRAQYCSSEVDSFDPGVLRIENPEKYDVNLSDELLALKEEMIQQHSFKDGGKVLTHKKRGE